MKLYLILFSMISFSFSHPLLAADDVIKSKDYKNEQTGSVTNSTNEESESTITPEQLEDMKKQVEKIKENQKKAAEFLEELDKE